MLLRADEVIADRDEVQPPLMCVKTASKSTNEIEVFLFVHMLSRLCRKIRQRRDGKA